MAFEEVLGAMARLVRSTTRTPAAPAPRVCGAGRGCRSRPGSADVHAAVRYALPAGWHIGTVTRPPRCARGPRRGCDAGRSRSITWHRGRTSARTLILASAIAARTTALNVLIAAAAVLPLYHQVRLAEDMAVLGQPQWRPGALRVRNRPPRRGYEHIRVNVGRRGRIADENLDLLLGCWPAILSTWTASGRVHVTPAAATDGGPRIMIAGGSTAAARQSRAGTDSGSHRSDTTPGPGGL